VTPEPAILAMGAFTLAKGQERAKRSSHQSAGIQKYGYPLILFWRICFDAVSLLLIAFLVK
jgi:hypothetical protein